MNRRCCDPKCATFKYYGARDVAVHPDWLAEKYGGRSGAYERFLAYMGERPPGTTLGRFNDTGNYEPGNCAWMTAKEQAQNRRTKGYARNVVTIS